MKLIGIRFVGSLLLVLMVGLHVPFVQAQPPQRGGNLVIGLKESFITLDPANHRSRVAETVIRNAFDGLVARHFARDEQGEIVADRIVPQIATSWEWLNPTEIVFKIRPGIQFHHGNPLTAEDVVFTFNRLITPGALCPDQPGQSSPRKGLLGPLTQVEALDDFTVKITLSEPLPIFVNLLQHQQIVPKSYLEQVGCAGFVQQPMGTGPFKVVKIQSDQVVMERFDSYYGGSPDIPPVGPAFLDRVIFQVIPESSTRVAALQAGQVHYIQELPRSLIHIIASDPNLRVTTAKGTRSFMVELNVNKDPFKNRLVRWAVNYAVDMRLVVDTIFAGQGTVFAGPLFPFETNVRPDLPVYERDGKRAKALLGAAGFSEGFPVILDTAGGDKEWCEAVATQLRDIGLEASVKVSDRAVLLPQLRAGERQMFCNSWGSSLLDPIGYFDAKLFSPAETGSGRGNFSGFSDPEIDTLITQAAKELDPERRKMLYWMAQTKVWFEAPWIFGFTVNEVEATSVRVQNLAASPDGRINLHDVWCLEGRC